MKSKKWLLTLVAVLGCVCFATGCNGEQTSDSAQASDSEIVTPNSGASGEEGEEKELREVAIAESALYNQYFKGDRVTLANAELLYSGTLTSERFEIEDPDGVKSTATDYTFEKVGVYTVTYYLELYAEIIYAKQTITVSEWNEDLAKGEIVSVDCTKEMYIGNSFLAPDTAIVNCFGKDEIGEFHSITAPDGTVITEKKTKLEQGGTYQVTYAVEINGRTVTASVEVESTYDLYALDGETSRAEYGYEGIRVELAEGDTFIVNKIVDLSAMDETDTLFSMKLDPEKTEEGLPDAMIINFRLTDVYDPTNYVTIQLNKRWDEPAYREWADPVSYLFIGGAEQTLGGYSVNGAFATSGKELNFSMVGNPAGQVLSVSFDYATRRILTANGIYGPVVGDLDDPNNYTGTGNFGTELWSGFTTGEAYLTVWAEDFRSTNKKAVIEFVDICGFGTLNYKTASFADGKPSADFEYGVETEFPEKSLVFEGKTYSARAEAITSPSGKLTKNPTSFKAEEYGVYRVVYTAEVDGETVYATYAMNVCEKSFTLGVPTLGEYAQGFEFTVPTATITFNGKTETATLASILSPDGETENAENNKLTLSAIGEYTLIYEAVFDGVTRTAEKKIKTVEIPEYLTVGKAESSFDKNASIPYAWSTGRLGVTLSAGDTATFNQVIDWSNKNYDNDTLFMLSFSQMTKEEYLGKNFYVILTNAENGNEQFKICYSIQANGDVYYNAFYTVNGETLKSSPTWGAVNGIGSDVCNNASTYGLAIQNLYIGTQGVRYTINGVNCTMDIENFFTKAVITLSTDTGISVAFANFNGGTDWQANFFPVRYHVGNETVHTETVKRDEKASYATKPVLNGKVFVGWYTSPEKAELADPSTVFDLNTPINGELDLYAGFADYLFALSASLKASYTVSETIVIPTGTFTLGSGAVTANVTVKNPDGQTVTLTENAFKPEKIGEYTVTYSAMDGSGTKTETRKFKVIEDLPFASVSSENSTWYKNAQNNYTYVNLAPSDTLTVNKPLSWKDVEANGKALFFLYLLDGTGADYADKEVTVKLTDAQDESKWISFRTYMYPNNGLSQMTVEIKTSNGYANTWWMNKFAGNDVGISYGFGVDVYDGGFYNGQASANQNLSFETLFGADGGFTEGILTVTSPTGILATFANLSYDL